MCVAVGITAREAHELWLRSGRDSWLFAQHEQAARQAGLCLSYARQGDTLIIETKTNVAKSMRGVLAGGKRADGTPNA